MVISLIIMYLLILNTNLFHLNRSYFLSIQLGFGARRRILVYQQTVNHSPLQIRLSCLVTEKYSPLYYHQMGSHSTPHSHEGRKFVLQYLAAHKKCDQLLELERKKVELLEKDSEKE